MSRFAPALRLLTRQSIAIRHSTRHSILTAASARTLHTTKPLKTPQETGSRTQLLSEFSLKDKVVVISGGGRGLGLVQAEAVLEAGGTVHCIDLLPPPTESNNPDFCRIAKRAKEQLGSSLTYHQSDVRNVPQLNKIMEGIANEKGRLDGLIAAAGINYESTALEYSAEEVDRMMSINISGAFMTAQAAARQMVRLKQPGSICMIASMSGSVANRGMYAAAYNTSKAGVIQLGRSLAAEWGAYGIRVNTLSPGYILTQMLRNLFDDYPERQEVWPKENMLGRFSTPNEFRGAAIFLLSDASSFMTGSDLRIDGGHTAW